MRTIQTILVVSGLSLLLPFAASAQSISEVRSMSPEDRRAYMESMSEEERTAKQEQWRTEFDALPDEEKEAIRKRSAERRDGQNRNRDRGAMRELWESMSDEERAVAKDRRLTRDAERRARWESMSDEDKAAARERRHRDRPGPDQPES